MQGVLKLFPTYFGVFVDARGRAGGLGLLWDKKVTLTLLSYSLHHMDAIVQLEGTGDTWRFTGMYGWAEAQYKGRTGEMIADLKTHVDLPWLVGGDLNEIFYHSEKRGGPPKTQTHIDSFRDAFVENGLFDLGYTGYDYTWCRRQDGTVVVEERLDRFFATVEWSLCFPEASVLHIDSDISYHLPILLKCYKRKPQF